MNKEIMREGFERVCGVSHDAYWNEQEQAYCWKERPYMTHLGMQEEYRTWILACEWVEANTTQEEREEMRNILGADDE